MVKKDLPAPLTIFRVAERALKLANNVHRLPLVRNARRAVRTGRLNERARMTVDTALRGSRRAGRARRRGMRECCTAPKHVCAARV